MSPLVIALAGMAALAIYSAIKDINPVDVIKNALQGDPPPGEGSWDPGMGLEFAGNAVGNYNNAVQGMVWPTKGHSITAQYGETGSYWETYHDGVDIDGACGDPIWSPVAGTVKSTSYAGAYGNRVVIKAFNYPDLEVWLCHLQSISVRPGKTVNPRDPLGRMGETGNAHGCHLHFMVVVDGADVNPNPYLGGVGSGTGIGVR